MPALPRSPTRGSRRRRSRSSSGSVSGRPSSSCIQSTISVSTSVHAGLVTQLMPCTPRPAVSRSPRIAGYDELAGKYAKKFGCCQWVRPGTITRVGVAHDRLEPVGRRRRMLGRAGRARRRVEPSERDPLLLDVLDVVGDPVDQLVAVPLEVLRSHRPPYPPPVESRAWAVVAGLECHHVDLTEDECCCRTSSTASTATPRPTDRWTSSTRRRARRTCRRRSPRRPTSTTPAERRRGHSSRGSARHRRSAAWRSCDWRTGWRPTPTSSSARRCATPANRCVTCATKSSRCWWTIFATWPRWPATSPDWPVGRTHPVTTRRFAASPWVCAARWRLGTTR